MAESRPLAIRNAGQSTPVHFNHPELGNVKDFPKNGAAHPQKDNEVFVVLYLGNAGYGHEFQTVLDAASLLGGEQVHFQFVGGGSQYAWIAAEAEKRGLKNISLNPYVPKEQTRRVMQRADCALITLENYALGVMSPSKLHANLACGLPIIYVGPEGSNVDRAIRDYACGISVRPGNSAMLADAIKSLAADQSKLTTLQENARHAFEAAYCDAKTLPLFDEVLEKMHHVKVR